MVKEWEVHGQVGGTVGEGQEGQDQLLLAKGRNTLSTRTAHTASNGETDDEAHDDSHREKEAKDGNR